MEFLQRTGGCNGSLPELRGTVRYTRANAQDPLWQARKSEWRGPGHTLSLTGGNVLPSFDGMLRVRAQSVRAFEGPSRICHPASYNGWPVSTTRRTRHSTACLVLEYIPSVNLYDIASAAITPAICTQLLSAIESFPSYGVIHNDITSTDIHFTPPEQPVRGIVIDFGCSMIREDEEEDYWMMLGALDVRRTRRLLENWDIRKSVPDECVSRFM